MMRIFLIGYMGAGKTTVGRELAKELGLDFIDIDHYIQARYQKTIADIFEEIGESGFRDLENKILREVGDIENVVISCGGGTPCFHNNMDYMNSIGKTVYLKASPKLLTQRLNTCKDKRPLIRDKSEEELYVYVEESLKNREHHYAKAHIIFETEELVKKDDAPKFVHELIEFINKHENIL